MFVLDSSLGERGKRHCLPHASIMIHRTFHPWLSHLTSNAFDCFELSEPSGGASGQASDIAIHAKEILRVRELLTDVYQRHCKKEGEDKVDAMKRFSALYHVLRL